MDEKFWHDKWENNEIGFHQPEVNPSLQAHLADLNLQAGSRIFLPLCGKTRDIAWLLRQGYSVVGAELSQIAVEQLFEELGLSPELVPVGELISYRAEHVEIFVGDIFKLSAGQLGVVDAIYDRAALIALPESLRRDYVSHLMAISAYAPQLLICYEYDQGLMEGPPFSIDADAVKAHYEADFVITRVKNEPLQEKLKGQVSAVESVWLLTAKVRR